jgi:hypothetical protein
MRRQSNLSRSWLLWQLRSPLRCKKQRQRSKQTRTNRRLRLRYRNVSLRMRHWLKRKEENCIIYRLNAKVLSLLDKQRPKLKLSHNN